MEIPYKDKSFRDACWVRLKKPNKPDIPAAEFNRFMYEAEVRGLNPLLGHLWVQERKGKYSFETTIDGLRFIAANTGELAGDDPVKFAYRDGGAQGSKELLFASVTVYRFQHGQRIPYNATAFFDEYVQRDRHNKIVSMWQNMAHSQLEKCAMARALRQGFPEMGQIYTGDEMAQSDNPPTAPPPQAPSETKPPSVTSDSPTEPSPVDAAQSTEQPGNGEGSQGNDRAEREQLIGTFKELALALGIKEADLSRAICLMAGIETLKEADLALIDSKIQLLRKMTIDGAKERIQELLNKSAQDSQVSAVEALATLQQALGSGKPIFDHLERKFGTKVVNATSTPEILRLAALPVGKLQEALDDAVDASIPY